MRVKAICLAATLAHGFLCDAAAISLPTVDLGYAIHQATLNVSSIF